MVVSEVCAVSEILCSVHDGHYIESDNSSVSDEDNGRCAHQTRISYLNKRETHFMRRICYLNKREMLIMEARILFT
jgi:hypothetical protein